jgi:hypothetical protein
MSPQISWWRMDVFDADGQLGKERSRKVPAVGLHLARAHRQRLEASMPSYYAICGAVEAKPLNVQ